MKAKGGYLAGIIVLSLIIWSCESILDFGSDKLDVSTNPATEVKSTSAISGGVIRNGGDYRVSSRGVCWSTLPNPEMQLSTKTRDSLGAGAFVSKIKGLKANSEYYIRAYAETDKEVVYGPELFFRTAAPSVPEVLTLGTDSVSSCSVSAAIQVESDGGAELKRCGVCIGKVPQPGISGQTVISGRPDTGLIHITIESLSANTTYYLRAFASNNVGTAYGEELVFTTGFATFPRVITRTVSDITTRSAFVTAAVDSDGGELVISRGICWSTNPQPSANQHPKIACGKGTGVFSGVVGPLLPATQYYVRSYAINSVGIAYGEQLTFKTAAN